jgi:filamentous hemagglutinin
LYSVKNAYEHYRKHRSEFPQYKNAIEYVEGAHDFMRNPPAGTLVKSRANGEKVFYHQQSETFAVLNSDEIPKTMFKPDPAKHGYPTNLDYFNAQ